MKYIKTFERIFIVENPERKLEINDYVKIYQKPGYYSEEFNDFVDTHFGKIIEIYSTPNDDGETIVVQFFKNNVHDIDVFLSRDFRFAEHEISISAKTTEELEAVLAANKYNL